jgi:hypothetical protein
VSLWYPRRSAWHASCEIEKWIKKFKVTQLEQKQIKEQKLQMHPE